MCRERGLEEKVPPMRHRTLSLSLSRPKSLWGALLHLPPPHPLRCESTLTSWRTSMEVSLALCEAAGCGACSARLGPGLVRCRVKRSTTMLSQLYTVLLFVNRMPLIGEAKAWSDTPNKQHNYVTQKGRLPQAKRRGGRIQSLPWPGLPSQLRNAGLGCSAHQLERD